MGGLRLDAAPRAARAPEMPLSDEQKAVVQNYSPLLVVNAFAGTGKTTSAVAYAAARPNKTVLYMPFTRANQADAAARMPANVTCMTTHAMAMRAIGTYYRGRVPTSWRAHAVRQELGLPNYRTAAITQGVLQRFFASADTQIHMRHASECKTQHGASEAEIAEGVANAKILWRRMQDRSDTVAVPHDAYLKMWSLTNPKLPYDIVILDEYQDTNPVTAHIVSQQTQATRVYIGDQHQAIYGFRGAVNAMADIGPSAHRMHLSQTWRFGPRTAAYANAVLGDLKGERVQIIGMGTDTPFVRGSSVTKLSRTNAQLFKEAALVKGEGVHWVGGIESYQLNKLLDAYHLFAGQPDRIADPFLRNFGSISEMTSYAEDAKDPETKILATIVEEYRHDTPALLAQIKENAVIDVKDSDLVLTTGHKSKGLDWDYVELAGDFEILDETEADLATDPYADIQEQEINLLYVAMTRAKKAVQLNAETQGWLAKLPEHRRNRQLARERASSRTKAMSP
jgi:F-box protein 18 (helicase)